MKKMIDCCSLFPFLAGLFLITGCTSDEEKLPSNRIEGNEVTFSFSLSGNNLSTRALDSSQESEIKTLDVLVFKEVTPGQEVFDYRFSVNPSDISTSNPRQFTSKVKLLSERQKFVLLTNVGDEVNLLSAAGQTKEDVLNALIVSNSGKWNVNNNFRALPMWGETDLVTLNSTSSVLPSHITLYRMQAKIDLRLSSTAQSKFSLKEVYLYKYNSFGRLVPDASNWSSGTATAPTLPLNPQTVAVPTWKYNSSDGVETTKAQNTIYLFETKAKNTSDPTDEFAIVVGGNYQGNSSLSYYRIDIKNTAKTQYVDILRNHHYTITISDVTSAGSNTPGDAYEGGGIAMSASVTAWNLATQNNVIDQQYILELDTTVAVLDYKGSIINIDVKTSSGKTWSIDTYLTNGVSAVVISNKIQIQNTNINPDKTEWDCGWIDVLVDNIKYRLKVVQEANPEHYPTTHNGWAGSNIYWDGTKLTFDDVNDHIHEKYQGVFFKWGSLWGIDPSGSNNALWSSNTNVVYKPEGSIETNVSWNSIPYCKPPTNSYPIAPKTGRDRHYLTEVHDPEKGLGDICKYLTERAGGTLHGKKWRMPTSTEFGINTDYQDYGGTWNLVNSFGSDGKFINSGKPGVTKASDIGIPFFSAAGYRSSIGELKSIGTYGFYWSASFTNSNAYILAISKVNILPASSLSFTLAASVRCVVE